MEGTLIYLDSFTKRRQFSFLNVLGYSSSTSTPPATRGAELNQPSCLRSYPFVEPPLAYPQNLQALDNRKIRYVSPRPFR